MGRDLKGRRWQFAWLPIAVLTLSLLGTLIGWLVVRGEEKSHIVRTITSAVASVRADLDFDMKTWIHEQVGLADLWKIEEPSYERWRAFANTFVEHHPGCLKLQWLDTGYHEHWIIHPDESRRQQLPSQREPQERLLAGALQSGQPAISYILTTDSGDKYWLAAVPIYQQKQFHGFVLASFDAQISLDAMLDDIQVLNFSVTVEANGNESYRLRGGNDRNKKEWMTAFDVPLPGNTWQMRIWPKQAALDEMRSGLPALTVFFGTVLSLLLAWIAQTNQSLRMEIAERQRAEEALRASEEELRRAHDHLELRVRERTAELAETNLSLQSEIGERIRAEEEVQELSRKVMRVQNEERRRLARELHDGAIQNLMAVSLNVNLLHEAAILEGADNKLQECAQLLQQSMNELRTISHLLHPPMLEELGVVRTLSSYVDGFSKRSGIQVKFQAAPELGRLEFDVELAIFRITQEALANIHRHSRSSSATIALARKNADVVLEIADLGRGIPERAERGVGITGMRERVRLLQGKLEINTSNKGVTIRAILPLAETNHCAAVN